MKSTIPFFLFFFFLVLIPFAFGDLKVGFYASSCPRAESIIRTIVQRYFKQDNSITAGLLRMHFHDCFVTGCDSSILIKSRDGNGEQDADANSNVRGYDLIDKVKSVLENECPSTVSCADIIALATRDAVSLSGGPEYNVPTGRRDGLRSNCLDVELPSPDSSISEAFQFFKSKGLTLNDMITLLGAHTVGFTHCSFVPLDDNSIEPILFKNLSKHCGGVPSNSDPIVVLDQKTSSVFDNEFYKQILLRRGMLHIDQQLALDSSSREVVMGFAKNGTSFMELFGDAMIKMGNIDVLEGNKGEIRKICSVVNSK